MYFFLLKPKMTSVISPTARLGAVPYFVKTGNTVKWGKKSIFQIGTENTPCDISNALSFITDQKSHTKTKNGGHLCPWGSKICLQAPKMVFKPYFRPLRAQMDSNFCFCVWFLISDKRQSVWYITRRIFCANLENRIFFTPFYSIASIYEIQYRA